MQMEKEENTIIFEWDQTDQLALRTTYQKQKRHNDVLPDVSDTVEDSAVQQQVELRRPARVVIISGNKWWQRRVRDRKMSVKTFNSENGYPYRQSLSITSLWWYGPIRHFLPTFSMWHLRTISCLVLESASCSVCRK